MDMTKAVPARATGRFHEQPAAPSLGGTFDATWIHKMDDVGAPPMIITPDATIDLQWIDGSFRVAGPDMAPKTERPPADGLVIGFRFRPGAAAAWLGLPVADMVGQRLALEDLWGGYARRMADKVRAHDGLPDLLASLDDVLAQHALPRQADPSMRTAFDLVEQGPPPGAHLVPWLMRALEISERTLRRRFAESFGYGPKTLDRILRYQRFLRLSRKSTASTAVLACEAGYSDQAHLVRESRRMSGITPLQLRRFDQAAAASAARSRGAASEGAPDLAPRSTCCSTAAQPGSVRATAGRSIQSKVPCEPEAGSPNRQRRPA
jgi:AraC-like DNA-binding protein